MSAQTVALRYWCLEDAPRLVDLLANPQVNRFLSIDLPRPYTLGDALDFIAHSNSSGAPEFAILLGKEVVGGIGAVLGENEALIGYWLGRSYWQQGIMKQALRLFLLELMKLAPGVQHISAQVFDFNLASQALLTTCGFKRTSDFKVMRAPDGLEHPVITFRYS